MLHYLLFHIMRHLYIRNHTFKPVWTHLGDCDYTCCPIMYSRAKISNKQHQSNFHPLEIPRETILDFSLGRLPQKINSQEWYLDVFRVVCLPVYLMVSLFHPTCLLSFDRAFFLHVSLRMWLDVSAVPVGNHLCWRWYVYSDRLGPRLTGC